MTRLESLDGVAHTVPAAVISILRWSARLKSETQREHYWNRYEDEQSDAVGQNKQPRRERLLA